MIQIEQIQQRRHEIAELRHADSVFRDIVARENERQDYEKNLQFLFNSSISSKSSLEIVE